MRRVQLLRGLPLPLLLMGLGLSQAAHADPADAPAVTAPALAAAPAGPDSADAAPVSTARMIHDFVSDDADAPPGPGPDQKPDRKVHGFVDAWVGTGGVRGFATGAVVPVGDHAALALSVSSGREPGYYGYGRYSGGYGNYNRFGAAFAMGPGVGDPSLAGRSIRDCRKLYTPSYLQGAPDPSTADGQPSCPAPTR